ncbi:hypothetical protein ASPCAL14184 [Aspergillus calidoustus]|uniref:Uncharacterized protein n=1 Tax=Aspergillus calidoustus TaxID=454130 RepID=A0A0U4ZP31_ASPCI|nr:hypothetical protein ASPCAL14184 [Aspergillus calidoustus]
MDPSLRPTLFVSIPSSEKVQRNHGSPIARGPQTAPPATSGISFSRENVADKRTRRRHRDGKGKSRDGIFRHRMHHIPSKVGGRGSLSTYREQESDDDGLLRPITRETTRSRWGSESTGIGPGSRRGSVLDGIDKDMRLGAIKRPEEIRSMGDLQRVRDQRNKGEEYLRSALSVIGTLATDITRRLDYTYYGLLEKVAALNVTIASFQELSGSTSKLFDDFQRETTGLQQDIQKQVADLNEFHPQMQKIEALEERMRVSKTRAKTLGYRLEAMRTEIEKWDKKEMDWQMRTNQRLRIFWGFVTAVILAILAAIVIQHWPGEEASPGFRTIPKALKLPNLPSRVPLPKKQGASAPEVKNDHAWSLDPSVLAHNISLSTPLATTPTSLEADEAARPTDHDPLRMFDEL